MEGTLWLSTSRARLRSPDGRMLNPSEKNTGFQRSYNNTADETLTGGGFYQRLTLRLAASSATSSTASGTSSSLTARFFGCTSSSLKSFNLAGGSTVERGYTCSTTSLIRLSISSVSPARNPTTAMGSTPVRGSKIG